MTTLNRTAPPSFKTIDRINVIRANASALTNGVPVYTISAGSQEITRVEFIFRAGMFYQPATLIASATNNLMETGTRSYTANEISEGVDFYGSFLECNVEQDYATITLYSLNRFLAQSLVFVAEVLLSPVFPEDEFNLWLASKRQKHNINSQKVSVLAKRNFSRMLFGDKHPYGIDVEDADFDRVNLGEIRRFFAERYTGNCAIIASGKLPGDLMEILNKQFGDAPWKYSAADDATMPRATSASKKQQYIEKADAVQSAIRIGRVLFNKTHPDYCKFQLLNTVFGGYFGSRLMANIREDKGYTYGIGSGLTNLVRSGYFFISTEVGADVTRAAIDEIYAEMQRMRDELVGEKELETVKNYVLGQFLRSVDGPFALADKFRAIWEYGLDYDYYDRYFDAVKSATPAELRDLANRYLVREEMMECVAGKMA